MKTSGIAILLSLCVLTPHAARAEDAGTGKDDGPPLSNREIAFSLQYGGPQYGGPQYGDLYDVASARRTRPAGHDRPVRDRSTVRDRWWARDKAKHLVGSALWTLSTQYVLVAKADWNEGDALPASIASGAAVGLAKEVYDRHTPPAYRFSTKDLAADAAGIALAMGVILL